MSTSLYLNLPYRVKDINLAKSAKDEINWIKKEMSGLSEIINKYKNSKPLEGMRICGTNDITIYSAVLIETLHTLGANVRWCASNIYSTQDHAAAYLASIGIPIFGWRNEEISEYWWTIFETLHFENNLGPTHIIDDKGDISLMLHRGVKGEKNSSILDLPQDTNIEKELNLFLKRVLAEDQKCWQTLIKNLNSISIDTKTANDQLQMAINDSDKNYTIVDLNTSIMKSKIDNYYSCKETIAEAIKRSTRTMIIGKSVLICGFGEIGRGCAESMKLNGAIVSIAETDPIRALEAAMQGYKVVELDKVCDSTDIFITATGKKHIIKLDHMHKMKDHAIICNMGHYELEIDYQQLNNTKEIKKIPVNNQLDRYFFPDGHSILLIADAKLANLTFDTTQLAFIKSCSYSVLILMQILLNQNKIQKGINNIPQYIDKEVANMHLNKIDAFITKIK